MHEPRHERRSHPSPFVVDEEGDPPLPDGWTKVESRSKKGKVYYFNSNTGESSWEHPLKPCTKKKKKKKKDVKKSKGMKDDVGQGIQAGASEGKQARMHKNADVIACQCGCKIRNDCLHAGLV